MKKKYKVREFSFIWWLGVSAGVGTAIGLAYFFYCALWIVMGP